MRILLRRPFHWCLVRADHIWHRWVCVRVAGSPYPVDDWGDNWPADLTELGAEEFDRFLRTLAEARRNSQDAPQRSERAMEDRRSRAPGLHRVSSSRG